MIVSIKASIKYTKSKECKYSDETKKKLLYTLKIFTEENFIKYLEDRNLPEDEIISLIGLRNDNFFRVKLEDTKESIRYINSDDCKLSQETKNKLLDIIKAKCPKIIKFLIENGTYIEAKDKYGRTLLQTALNSNDNNVLTIFLLDYGASVEHLSVDEKNKLDKIVKIYKYNPLEFLVKNRADDDWIRKSLTRNIELFRDVKACNILRETKEKHENSLSYRTKQSIKELHRHYFNECAIKFLEENNM
ncbi:MAG: hypothetical protein EOO43_14790, partial [Flavobacterium sp.]